MHVDAVIFTRTENVVLKSVPGYVYFRNNYSKYFRTTNLIFARYRGKELLGSWRLIPNRSTDFYRCEKVDSKTSESLEKTFNEYIKKESETFNEQTGEEFYGALGDDSD